MGVKTFDAQGRFNGERRFVGLFTSSAYSLPTREVPLLRTKCAAVMARAGLAPASHDGKALAHILDSFPRDELFQFSEDDLTFIVQPDGSARKVENSWLHYDATALPPGSAIVVPRDLAPVDVRQLALDITSILSSFAVTAASLAVLAKQ